MAKKAIKKKATGRKASASKPTVRKASPTKKVAKKAASKAAAKKTTKKVVKKPVKKAPAKAPSKKSATKAPAKGSAKKAPVKKAPAKAAPAKKAAAKKAPEKKDAPKQSPSKKAAPKKAAAKKAAAKKAPAATSANQKSTDDKSGRKGITIVASKVKRKRVVAQKPPAMVPPLSGSILGMGLSGSRPLIQSGPKAPPITSDRTDTPEPSGKKPKSPFTKRQLDKYREILIRKRHELLGDIDSMETEALKSESGSLSHLPQHMAEQGSEAYEQTLALDLAATDRKLLLEIDAALDRIAAKVYGLCEHTGKEISKERLDELPWARYSIEAAREMERRAT